jgi:hypothetical protein
MSTGEAFTQTPEHRDPGYALYAGGGRRRRVPGSQEDASTSPAAVSSALALTTRARVVPAYASAGMHDV